MLKQGLIYAKEIFGAKKVSLGVFKDIALDEVWQCDFVRSMEEVVERNNEKEITERFSEKKMMRVKFLIVASILSLSLLNGCASDFSEGGSKVSSADESSEAGAGKNDATGAGEYKYDIEKAFPEDESLKEILEGKTMPVSVTYGLGGEGGYEQFTSKDPELISELITTFREMKIQEEVTDRDKMIFFDDAIEDYILVLDNGVQVMVTLDAGYVAYGENVQYLFESSKGLTKFKNEIRESGSAEDDGFTG